MKKTTALSINKLSIAVEDKPILYDIELTIKTGEIHAIMGPNGSGKSSLAYALMGHPRYTATAGSAQLNDIDLLSLPVHERAQHGLFLALQYPCEIPGVSIASFLKEAYIAVTGTHISATDFQQILNARCAQLLIDPLCTSRGLHEGFSGGEKKRLELLQLLILKPKIAILDEIDSGLDIDSLKIVADGIALARHENPDMSIILITHYQRILNYITPDRVHILCNGQIVTSGDHTIAHMLEKQGYDAWKQ